MNVKSLIGETQYSRRRRRLSVGNPGLSNLDFLGTSTRTILDSSDRHAKIIDELHFLGRRWSLRKTWVHIEIDAVSERTFVMMFAILLPLLPALESNIHKLKSINGLAFLMRSVSYWQFELDALRGVCEGQARYDGRE